MKLRKVRFTQGTLTSVIGLTVETKDNHQKGLVGCNHGIGLNEESKYYYKRLEKGFLFL